MIDKIKELLSENLSKKKTEHTFSVADEVKALAKIFNIPDERLYLAALLHDLTREWDTRKQIDFCREHDIALSANDINSVGVLHSITASHTALEITKDKRIAKAIRYHTTGRPNMTLEEKILFFADFIEPGRRYLQCAYQRTKFYDDVKEGKSPQKALDEGIYSTLNHTICHLADKGSFIHPDTLRARNYYCLRFAAVERKA